MRLGKTLAFLSIACWFLTAMPADAALKRSARRPTGSTTGGSVSGIVVKAHGKTPVAGARVRFARHHAKHKHHSLPAGTSTTKPSKAVGKAAAIRAKLRQAVAKGVLTNSKGQFSLKAPRAGSHLIVAHKKHVGSGHARVSLTAGQAANVTIRLHKHHHSHTKKA